METNFYTQQRAVKQEKRKERERERTLSIEKYEQEQKFKKLNTCKSEQTHQVFTFKNIPSEQFQSTQPLKINDENKHESGNPIIKVVDDLLQSEMHV